jgi:hypothetical protein
LTDIGCLGYSPLSSLCVDTCDAQKSHDGVRRDARETIGSDGTSDEGKSPYHIASRDVGREATDEGERRSDRDPRPESGEARLDGVCPILLYFRYMARFETHFTHGVNNNTVWRTTARLRFSSPSRNTGTALPNRLVRLGGVVCRCREGSIWSLQSPCPFHD